jgi:threonylcarbamoyladenosine tRNA methylthiotransferase MtaB
LIDHGYREIVLTGIHLGHYGVDINRGLPKSQWTRLSHLVEKMANLPGDFRLRLSSLEAPEVTRELLTVMQSYPDRICPHLHLCLQSGSDAVLRRMHRRWGMRRIRDRCDLVREMLDQPALTTDVIVGFPGETELDFDKTCTAVRDCQFSKVHIFPFSRRRGTPAAAMSAQVPSQVIHDRSRRLMAVERETRSNYFRSLQNRTLRMLIETVNPTECWGTSCRYAPAQLAGWHHPPRQGELVDVLIRDSIEDAYLVARPCAEPLVGARVSAIML